MGLKLIYVGGSGPLAADFPNPLYTVGETYQVLRSQPGYVVMTSNHQFNGLEWSTMSWVEHFRLLDGAPPAALDTPSAEALTDDPVNHPAHYTTHPSGVECIQITEHMNFCRGNAVKYIWRAGDKGDEIEDLKKARWYLDREIARLEKP